MSDTIFVKHSDGGTHMLSGRRAAKLRRECLAGRGMAEIVELRLAGYEGFIGEGAASEVVEDLDALPDYYAAKR